MNLWSNNAMFLTEKSIDYLWKKQEVSANNIANSETPNFKSSYVTFEEELQQQIGRLRSPKAREIREEIASASPRVHTTVGEKNKMDTCDLYEVSLYSKKKLLAENVELAKTGIQYEYAVRAIGDDFTRLRTAIKGT